ncbi:ComEA family DNA-binding protein [Aliidiomarina quisquiliarum]|uniref:ComEA family DNA-binding protein n=1 Tax=Aliidiomarina quisquiliarum TaxID=2938947 RepID=UPI00208F0A3A|nr:helix-hairpin-helix domain-containing protein [Aliidiomarina quisquiliarum]MCO4320851.1 helix-hairpin-helix domain-containing protein [Aliidiomarina quisquiliarum]
MLRKTILFASLISPLVLACPPQVYASDLPSRTVAPDKAAAEKRMENLVNINTASAEELAAGLKGVGMARARAIIELRERLGGFTDIDQLLEVRGLGVRTLDANRSHIRL